jgi:hypothetical protein
VSDLRRVHHAGTRVMSVILIGLGVAIVIATVAAGGGPIATGVLVGLMFVAAGGARLYLQRRTDT